MTKQEVREFCIDIRGNLCHECKDSDEKCCEGEVKAVLKSDYQSLEEALAHSARTNKSLVEFNLKLEEKLRTATDALEIIARADIRKTILDLPEFAREALDRIRKGK